MQLLRKNKIAFESLHAPYGGISAMWGEDEAAEQIGESRYEGALMPGIGKLATVDGKRVCGDISDEEYDKRAANAAKRVAEMAEAYRIERR